MKTKHVFNLTLLCSALVLSGCGGGGSGDNKTSSGTKLEPYLETSMARATTQTFILEGENKHVPFNNNFFYDTDTQSLKFPSDGNDDISNPRAALSYAGGFSTTMPIYIEFSGVGFGDSAKSTLLGEISPDAAKLVKTEEDGTFKLLESGRDFFVATQGNRVSIIPLKPLDDSSNYLVVVTDELRDKNNQPVGVSRSYARLKSNKRSYKGGALEIAQNAIKRQEQLADHSGIDTTKIVYSALFTTAPVGKVLTNTASLLAKNSTKLASVWNGSSNPKNVDLENAYTFHSIKNKTSYYTGKVKLPYFLETDPASYDSVPFEPTVAQGKAVTHYPKIKSLQDVPFVLYSPANPTGIVIYQHGITTFKETVESIAPKLVAKKLAVIAIDHPLHGKRRISDEIVADKKNADVYLNLGALPVARDNMRQSVLDIIGLRIALRDLELERDDHELRTLLENAKDNVKFLGHSMGGIVGIPAVSIAQNLSSDPNNNINLGFTSAVYSSAGGHIAELLFASGSFGPDIKHKLLMKASPDYQSLANSHCSVKDASCFIDLEKNYSEVIAAMEKGLVPFKVAAQTLVDVVDPYSFLGSSYNKGALSVPTMLVQINGDKVVPNGVVEGVGMSYGTNGLFSLLNLEAPSKDKNRVFAKFTSSNTFHSSLLFPLLDEDGKPIPKPIGVGFIGDLEMEQIQTLVVDFLKHNKMGIDKVGFLTN
ncbi:lipase [Vibrio caribbeanicus]|uniref:Putative lipase n=1 Tax=Vibrio caribbeanicus ATCC BAA-2122 TaxID=796620 RepID=E3BJB7_9VIBR|nr:lipase [Vibrio caribbeanicus]EFP96686.1 putative lipase [Vibrio caribbeanicus ATCC BAA-2122]